MGYQIDTFLDHLSRYSKEGLGVTRLAFTEESRNARDYICRTMEAIGLTVHTDIYGTVVGHLGGRQKESVMIGSHYDSVIHGGKYDGAAGIAIGLAVADGYVKRGEIPPCSLDILATNDEEGVILSSSFLSSKSMCGLLDEESYSNPATGKDLRGFLAENWYGERKRDGDGLTLDTTLKHTVQYIEPHVEQGGILWESGEKIGIVTHIVGLARLYVTLYGVSNHAGTTPMSLRRDPMAAAGRIIGAIPGLASRYEGAVATVGQISAAPNVSNVIPEKVGFSVDIRSSDNHEKERLTEEIKKLIADEKSVTYKIEQKVDEPAVPMDGKLAEAMEGICKKRGISYRIMNSGAGHDAQLFSQFLDTVMLFVPSRNGISHSPEEYSRTEDLEMAADVLNDYLDHMMWGRSVDC